LNVKERRFTEARAMGKSVAEAAEAAGYSARYAARLDARADIKAEVARVADRAKTEDAKRELREYLLDVMRGDTGEELAKIQDRIRAAEFFDRYFGETEQQNVLEVIVDYGDTT